MKNKSLQKLLSLAAFIAVTTIILAGCGQSNTTNDVAPPPPSASVPTPNVDVSAPTPPDVSVPTPPDMSAPTPPDVSVPTPPDVSTPTPPDVSAPPPNADVSGTENENQGASSATVQTNSATELYVQFGDDGTPFTMYLYDNDTAAAIARHVGTAAWRIPLYNYEGYDNWEVMQYYDIPSRYEIPSKPESVTSEQMGAVYYSEPNRIVLFYGEAEVSGEYTPVGYFDTTPEFVSAVKDNPVLEGWGNKIVHISAEK